MASRRWLLAVSAVLLGCLCQQALPQRVLGGWEDADPDEPGVRQALRFAVNEYNRASNDVFSSRVSEIVSAQKQIVSGLNYYFTVKVGRTVCRKGVTDVENCAFHEAPNLAKTMTCTFKVYSVPWAGTISLTKSSCT